MSVSDVREMESRLFGHDASFDVGVNDDEDKAYAVPANYLEKGRQRSAVAVGKR